MVHYTLSIVVLVIVIIVEKSVSLVWNVSVLTVLHWHVDLLSVLSLLHMQRRVSVVEASTSWVLSGGDTLHRSHCLVLGIKNFRDIGFQFLLF